VTGKNQELESGAGSNISKAFRFTTTLKPKEIVERKFGEIGPTYATVFEGTPDSHDTSITTISFLSSLKPFEGKDKTNIIMVNKGEITICWHCCQINVIAPAEESEKLIPALLDFDQVMREVQKLQQVLPSIESVAISDVPGTLRIRRKDSAQWKRIGSIMENLARMRLEFARFEALVFNPASDLSPLAKRIFRSLVRKADLENKLESLSDRMEVLEDLYEGAVDRINDHRYWRDGHILEIIIIVLLAGEVLLLIADLARGLWE